MEEEVTYAGRTSTGRKPMREILFRGKRIEDKEWVYGTYMAHDRDGHTIFNQNLGDGTLQGFEVIPETVGQYAELKDKNGVKIFEGDVVRYLNSIESGNGVVIFDTCAFLFNWIDIDETDSLLRYFQCSKELEIIGNIHEIPAVLNEYHSKIRQDFVMLEVE
jgi:uncharacterized phage protein (TIGR01671 family)